MALQKEIDTTGTGIACSYWKVVTVRLDCVSSTATVIVDGWMNEDLRRGGKASMGVLDFRIGGDFDIHAGDIVAEVYRLIKLEGEFDGAADC